MNLETISESELQSLFQKSQESPRKRAIKMFHDNNYEGSQVCLNVIQPESYIQPHFRYCDESLIHYQGMLCAIQFDEQGNVKKSDMLVKSSPYLFIPAKTFMSVVSLEENSALWMVVQGPHDPKKFSEFLHYDKLCSYASVLSYSV